MAKTASKSDASDRKPNSRLAHARVRAEDVYRKEGQKRQRSVDNMRLRWGRGFKSCEGSVPASANGLTHRFFSWSQILIFFKINQVFRSPGGKFVRQNKGSRSSQISFSSIYFLAGPAQRCSKNVAKFPGGGQ